MDEDIIESIWKQASLAKGDVENRSEMFQNTICMNCESDNIIYECIDGNVCGDCGTVIDRYSQFSTYSYEEPVTYTKSLAKVYTSSRLQKMQEWMAYTNKEKNEYKLKMYIRDLCEKLQIQDSIIDNVCELVNKVMNSIKDKNDGPKRSRVKDGIIISCIYYISKEHNLQLNYAELAKKINLDIKYISKADKILMELTFLNEDIINKIEDPMDYIKNIVNKHALHSKINNLQIILNTTQVLIDVCEDNDILLDHTPLSIGCTCFYYVLIREQIDVDIILFSEMFGLSNVTLVKTYNKLKNLKSKIEKFLTN
jgi:transcription initiation factor TFIIIB Brf1 subunit/transcription initiation factor TFIIB